ncbi:hypothetical protein CUMW_261440 [Citrus unshiu]|uniref:NB-ARC domain-containing protein n=1 Tax=Citrus unshiu TaxID=55188 RepID=A0A2H5QTZ3_CITUN|nr:hypothetical protein CUMW_261440 [Citrus unshiu]
MVTKVVDMQNVRDQELDRLCLGGFCSKDLASGYDFRKKVAMLTEQVILLKNERGEIKEIAEMAPQDAAVELAVEQMNQYLIKLGDVPMIKKRRGELLACTVQGVSKTTLLKQVNNKFCSQQQQQQHHFDVVLWTVVSREPNLDKIQDAIGKRIALSAESWKDKSLQDKALDISNILSRKNFILNISSKVVFTTRFLDVCGSMEADENIEKVGNATLRCHSDIPEIVQTLARECWFATSTENNWLSHVLQKKNPMNGSMEENVFARSKFSYGSLPSYTIRSFLVFLFPEYYEVYKGELIDYWISEAFVIDFDEGSTIISDLLHACLLEKIACKIEEEGNILLHVGVFLIAAPKIEEWEEVKRISLMDNNITSLSTIPNCPCLLTLLLYIIKISMIIDGFFQFMPSLNVLNLGFFIFLTKLPSLTVIREFPEEMKALVNLRYLNLEYVTSKNDCLQLLHNFLNLQALKMLGCSNYNGEEEDRALY